VAYGLALNLPQIKGESDEGIPAIESATLIIVVLSTLIIGGATGPLLRFFNLQVCARGCSCERPYCAHAQGALAGGCPTGRWKGPGL
jgi:hypothetical protein